jgi:hypothetical protein
MPNSNLTYKLPDLSSETLHLRQRCLRQVERHKAVVRAEVAVGSQSQLCQADVLPAQRGDGNSRDVNVGLVSPHEYYSYKML